MGQPADSKALLHNASTTRIELNTKGQSLVEAALMLPLMMTLLLTFFAFLYEQLWSQLIEHILHETLVCEQTFEEMNCLVTANIKANRYNLFGAVLIHRSSPNELLAEMIIFRKLKWKTLSIKEKPIPDKI